MKFSFVCFVVLCFCLCVCVCVCMVCLCVCLSLCFYHSEWTSKRHRFFRYIRSWEKTIKKKIFFWPLYWGALFHREKTVMNPQNTKCHRSTKIIFFRHFWYFPITKAIHTYVLAKFKKNSIFLFSTPLLDYYWRPLIKEALWKRPGQ